MIVVTGVASTTGGVTPSIADMVIGAGAVSGNAAVTTPEFGSFAACVEVPATVKKSCDTPVAVKPVVGVRVIVAVYTLDPRYGLSVGDHVVVPVNCLVAVTVVSGTAPTTGTVTPPIVDMVIGTGGAPVATVR